MQKINKSLHQTIKKYHLEEKVKSYQVCKAWDKVIADFFPEAAGKTAAVTLEKGVLKVASLSKEVAYNIRLYSTRIIEAINSLLGKNVVFAIYCES